jgi:hypothetical protein
MVRILTANFRVIDANLKKKGEHRTSNIEHPILNGQTLAVKRRRILLIVGGMILAIAFAVIVWPGEREPEYQGKKLSEWVGLYRPGTAGPTMSPGHSYSEVRRAVRCMGTNGLRFLVRWISYEKPAWRRRIELAGTHLPTFVIKTRLFRWWMRDNRTYRADAALFVLAGLDQEILSISKDLERMEAAKKSGMPSKRARSVMLWVGYRLPEEDRRKLGPQWFMPTNAAPRIIRVVQRPSDTIPGFEPLPLR